MIIKQPAQSTMIQDAESTYPEECCGFFFSSQKGGVIDRVLVIPNKKEGPRNRRFLMDPMDFMRAEEEADQKGWELRGIYHSHPDHPSRPSEFDREHAWPNLSYIILSVRNGTTQSIQSWRLDDQRQFQEESISIHQNQQNHG